MKKRVTEIKIARLAAMERSWDWRLTGGSLVATRTKCAGSTLPVQRFGVEAQQTLPLGAANTALKAGATPRI